MQRIHFHSDNLLESFDALMLNSQYVFDVVLSSVRSTVAAKQIGYSWHAHDFLEH